MYSTIHKGSKMNILNKALLITLSMTSLQTFANSGASENTSAASKHSALAVAHGSAASVKVASAVIATPLIVVGSVGVVSSGAGSALMESAIATTPLEITDKTITAAPSPAQMMKANKQENL